MSDKRVEHRKISELIPDINNANLGTERGLRALDDSLGEVGLGRSVVTDKHGTIIAGNKTVERAADRGFEDAIIVHTDGKQLVVVQRDDLDLADNDPNNNARKLAFYDNRVAELDLSWNPEQLAADKEAGIEIVDKLWSPVELDILGVGDGDVVEDAGAQIDRAAELQEKWQVERGDIWQISKHRIMCGDSTCAEDVEKLMDGVKMQGVFTSPPYAMQRKDQYGGIPADEYVEWWDGVQSCVRSILKKDGSFFVNIKPHCENGERVLYVFDMVLAMKRRWGWRFVDELCWTRIGVPKMVKYRFKNAFEPIYQFSIIQDFRFRPKSVQHDSYNVPIPGGEGVGNTNWAKWQGSTGNLFGGNYSKEGKAYPSNLIKPFNNDKSRSHPAAFATQLVEFFVKAYSDENDNWYDPFLGSGTTIVAAENTGRVGYGMEIAPEYCSVALERLADMGLSPERLSDA